MSASIRTRPIRERADASSSSWAFEIVSTQSLGAAGRKAAKLAGRGVRRVFAIDVERSRAMEWSAELGTWREIDPAGQIDDGCGSFTSTEN